MADEAKDDNKKDKEETKTDEAAETKEESTSSADKKSEPSGKFADLIKQIEELSVMELADLVKELEDRFGVSAAAPIAVAAAPSAGDDAGGGEEKSAYTIHLADGGDQKIAVIKVVREIVPELGLKEAKDLVDGAPKDIKKDVPKEDAEAAKEKLEAAGAKVELN